MKRSLPQRKPPEQRQTDSLFGRGFTATRPKPRRQWKRLRPTSLSNAIELCLEYAREVHNLSVDRVADLMGLPSKWVIYKWMESTRMPANMIRPFEHACGIDYVTRWISHSGGKLLIDIPTGRSAAHKELPDLQLAVHEAVGLLLKFYAEKAGADETLAAIRGVMEDLAWHSREVEKYTQPEFDFKGDCNDDD